MSPSAQVGSDPPRERAPENKGDEEMNETTLRRKIAVLVFAAFVALTGEVATLAVMADDADARRSRVASQ